MHLVSEARDASRWIDFYAPEPVLFNLLSNNVDGTPCMSDHARGGRSEKVILEPGPVRRDDDAIAAVSFGFIEYRSAGVPGNDLRNGFVS